MSNKYMSDRVIPDSIYNRYMKQWEKKYQLKYEYGMWKIKCKYGEIEPQNITSGLLMYSGFYKTHKKLIHEKRKIYKDSWYISHEGYTEFSLVFPEGDLDKIAELFYARKKRKLSPEHKKKLIESSTSYRFRKHTVLK